jgi:hypothetical protein
MIIAFVVGLHVRHNVETGGFLLQDVVQKFTDRASKGLEQPPAEGDPQPGETAPPPAANN